MREREIDRAGDAWSLMVGAGARRTLARSSVIDALAESPVHLTVTEIHQRVVERFPRINLSTVHRTVATLVEYGAVHPLAWPGEARYGLSTQPHVHAVCEVCGSMSEIPAARLAPAVAEAGWASGLDLPADGLALFGRCPSCRRAASRHAAEAGSGGSHRS
jgi:Fur family ferric uptake transcriptional regulator